MDKFKERANELTNYLNQLTMEFYTHPDYNDTEFNSKAEDILEHLRRAIIGLNGLVKTDEAGLFGEPAPGKTFLLSSFTNPFEAPKFTIPNIDRELLDLTDNIEDLYAPSPNFEDDSLDSDDIEFLYAPSPNFDDEDSLGFGDSDSLGFGDKDSLGFGDNLF